MGYHRIPQRSRSPPHDEQPDLALAGPTCPTRPGVHRPGTARPRCLHGRAAACGIHRSFRTPVIEAQPARNWHAGAMIAAANPMAVEAGLEILNAGGTAVDAAIAVQAMLGLVEPQSSGIGGSAFMLHYDARTGDVVALQQSRGCTGRGDARHVPGQGWQAAALPRRRQTGR